MLSVKGIYENGQIEILEQLPPIKKALEEELVNTAEEEIDLTLFDDLTGTVDMREDGSVF